MIKLLPPVEEPDIIALIVRPVAVELEMVELILRPNEPKARLPLIREPKGLPAPV